MVKISPLVILLVICSKCFCQKISRTIITKDYFKLVKPFDAKFDAILYHGLVYNFKVTEAIEKKLKIDFQVKVDFVPSKSYFTDETSEINDLLLRHEQGHADIATIYARKLLTALSSEKYYSIGYRNQMQKIYDYVKDSLASEHILYDQETYHGRDLRNQQKWSFRLENAINN